jgi:precorrin-6A synthase
MREIKLIGIGAGHPEHLTVQAINGLRRADVVFLTDKGPETADLVRARLAICERYVSDHPQRIVTVEDPPREGRGTEYGSAVRSWHEARTLLYEQLIERHLVDGQCGAWLVWGEPSLYDSALRIMDLLIARRKIAFTYEVIPGISSIQALAAAHRISVHEIGEPFRVTTGRQLSDGDFDSSSSVIVLLDGQCAFGNLQRADLTIYWGAYVGTSDEILISGPLTAVRDRIREARAAARQRKGWIMDTYLLRRNDSHHSGPAGAAM